MEIETIPVGPYEVNCYIVRMPDARAIVVDPGDDADRIEAVITRQGLRICAYLVTHGHTDHLCALAPLHKKYPAPIAAHADDARWMFSERNQLPPYYPAPGRPHEELRLVADGEELEYGGMECRVITTPGHSPGGICFHFEEDGVLFAGDTLFQGSVGRTDLPGGSAKTLSLSLRKLATLPDSTRVYPGHGPSTTIAMEKKTNYFLRGMA